MGSKGGCAVNEKHHFHVFIPCHVKSGDENITDLFRKLNDLYCFR